MPSVDDILNATRGHIVAPAGCGKTELIAKTIARPTEKPSLVLTHTTAGIAALRNRLNKANVPTKNYRLNTIAGWALVMVSMFPERCQYKHNPLQPPNYIAIQNAVGRLCQSGNITKELQSTYSRLLVDEYQDCSVSQHQIVHGLSQVMATVIFGDPMQAIFGFNNDPLPDWNTVITSTFPSLGALDTPWRWNNAAANDLGDWLLQVRTALEAGHSINLASCPNRVLWRQLGNDETDNTKAQIQAQYAITNANPNETLLIIGDSRQAALRHQYASRAIGVSVVEPVDFRDIVTIADRMDGQTGHDLLDSCIHFLVQVMTNVYGDKLKQRMQSIKAGRNRNAPTDQELAAIQLSESGRFSEAINFLTSMDADRERRIYRRSAFNIMMEALKIASSDSNISLSEAIALLREKRRHAGRSIPYKAVGSTLLLKGLEADHVLILDADRPQNEMTKEHLYVALTRGAKSVTIFSRNSVLP